MKYTSFRVSNYKGIRETITVDISKKSIIPIIGVNESGKTSLLEAILAFDSYNDNTNEGSHLEDTENFYDPGDGAPAIIRAYIEVSKKEILEILELALKEKRKVDAQGIKLNLLPETTEEEIGELQSKPHDLSNFFIERTVGTRTYSTPIETTTDLNKFVCDTLVKKLPYILYFDDFRDSMERLIKVPERKGETNESKWIPYFQELFQSLNSDYDIYTIASKNSSIRKAIIREAQKELQKQLTTHWQNFSLQDSAPLKIELQYHDNDTIHYIEVHIVEEIPGSDGKKEDRFFNIKDRSKGFFWYFNFIMKLKFNPQKRDHYDSDTIYLLDEPGSYLHSTAQKKLCDRLKSLSRKNKVIYCTHSPYLLDPEYIPINNILVAHKEEAGKINIEPIHEIPLRRQNAAFQPILDALEIVPVSLDYDKNNIVITEGIYDYYVFNLFKTRKTLNYFPASNAASMKHHISYMIFLGKKYSAVWDLDSEGKRAFEEAKASLGEIESLRWGFYKKGKKSKVLLQDLFEGEDIKMIKTDLALPQNSGFNKVIVALYHSSKRKSILRKISNKTKANIKAIENEIFSRTK